MDETDRKLGCSLAIYICRQRRGWLLVRILSEAGHDFALEMITRH